MELYKDLIKTLKVVNRFEIALVLGGEYDEERPAAILVAKQAHVNIPTIETDDVLGTSVNLRLFRQIWMLVTKVTLGFSSKYTRTTINNLIVNGDGASEAVTAITVKSAGNVATLNRSATLQMSVEVTPSSAKNKDVTWAITAGDAATINATGLLTADASKTGAVTIEATKDGSGVKGTKVITITAGG